jgi:hypothetical protein
MDLSRVMGGQTPFVTNVPVYKATTAIDDGALLTFSGNTANLKGAQLSVAITTAANENAIGVTQVSSSQASASRENSSLNSHAFRIGTDGLADDSTPTGQDWLPLCVNPDALYYAWYSTTVTGDTTSDIIELGISASTGTVVTIASTSTDLAGGWLYTDDESSSTFSGSLRHINTTVAANSFGLNTAVNVSTDSEIIWASAPITKQTIIGSGGNYLRSYSGATYGKAAQSLLILDNYVIHDQAPLHPLRQWVDDGLDGLTETRIFSELAVTDSYFVNG